MAIGYSYKVIATADEAKPLGTTVEDAFSGIGAPCNRDPVQRVFLMFSTTNNAAPSAAEVVRVGAELDPHEQQQTQYVNEGTPIKDYYVTCHPLHVEAGAVIERGAYVCDEANAAYTFILANFTQPAVDANVAVSVLDSAVACLSVGGLPVESRVFVAGGGFYDVVSIDSATQVTLKYRGEPGAVVTVTA